MRQMRRRFRNGRKLTFPTSHFRGFASGHLQPIHLSHLKKIVNGEKSISFINKCGQKALFIMGKLAGTRYKILYIKKKIPWNSQIIVKKVYTCIVGELSTFHHTSFRKVVILTVRHWPFHFTPKEMSFSLVMVMEKIYVDRLRFDVGLNAPGNHSLPVVLIHKSS